MPTQEQMSRQYWLWVTKPQYYLDDDGSERADLDPTYCGDTSGWWTCHTKTQRGDLIFLYRTRPRCDIAYLIQAESDAYPISDDEYAAEQGWSYGCDYQVIHKFINPLPISTIRDDPYLQDWPAFRGRFQRSVFSIPPDIWKKLNQYLAQGDTSYKKLLSRLKQEPVLKEIVLEEELEEELANDLGRLKPHGFNVRLWQDPSSGLTGRQLICTGNGGRIDLLCYDSRRRRFVVIELKNVRAGQNTFGQISNYMGWVEERIAGDIPVIGLVISRGYDVKFQSSLRTSKSVFHLDLENIGFK